MGRKALAGGAVVLGMLVAGRAWTWGLPPDQQVLLNRAILDSDRIARVLAVSETSYVVPRKRARAAEARTDWQLRVLESWKGRMPADRRLTLRLKRGRVGELATTAEGEPEVLRGEEYVVFLRADSTARVYRPFDPAWGCVHSVRSILTLPPPNQR